MQRRMILALTVAMILMAGCTGTSGNQGASTGTVTTIADTTDTATTAIATATTDHGDTTAKTSTSASTTRNEAPYTLFAGGNPRSKASLGPRTFTEGKPVTVDLEISNEEGQRMNYTTVIQVARFNSTGPNATITNRWVLDQSTTTVEPDEQRTITRNVTPNTTGQNLLLEFLLYRSDPPATPTYDNSYQNFSTSINVTTSPKQENETVVQL